MCLMRDCGHAVRVTSVPSTCPCSCQQASWHTQLVLLDVCLSEEAEQLIMLADNGLNRVPSAEDVHARFPHRDSARSASASLSSCH